VGGPLHARLGRERPRSALTPESLAGTPTAVVLAVNGFRAEERARRVLYTGLSRARVLLVVVGPRAEIERLGGEAVRRRLHDAAEWSPGR